MPSTHLSGGNSACILENPPVEREAQAGLRIGLAPEVARDGHQPIPHQQDHRHQTCPRQHARMSAVAGSHTHT